jgi:hypothetical protein
MVVLRLIAKSPADYMSHYTTFRRFRPYLFNSYRTSLQQNHNVCGLIPPISFTQDRCAGTHQPTNDYEKRVRQLNGYGDASQWYPRLQHTSELRSTVGDFRQRHGHLDNGETEPDRKEIVSGV